MQGDLRQRSFFLGWEIHTSAIKDIGVSETAHGQKVSISVLQWGSSGNLPVATWFFWANMSAITKVLFLALDCSPHLDSVQVCYPAGWAVELSLRRCVLWELGAVARLFLKQEENTSELDI